MWGPSTGTRHSCTDHDGDTYAGKDEEQADVVEGRKSTISKEHNAAAAPCDDEVANEDVPRLGGLLSNKRWVRDCAFVPWLEIRDDKWHTSEQFGFLERFSISSMIWFSSTHQ